MQPIIACLPLLQETTAHLALGAFGAGCLLWAKQGYRMTSCWHSTQRSTKIIQSHLSNTGSFSSFWSIKNSSPLCKGSIPFSHVHMICIPGHHPNHPHDLPWALPPQAPHIAPRVARPLDPRHEIPRSCPKCWTRRSRRLGPYRRASCRWKGSPMKPKPNWAVSPFGRRIIQHWVPSGNLTWLLKPWPFYSWFSHWKSGFSIVMLVYQRVCHGETNGDLGKCDTFEGPPSPAPPQNQGEKNWPGSLVPSPLAYQHAMGCTALGSTVDSWYWAASHRELGDDPSDASPESWLKWPGSTLRSRRWLETIHHLCPLRIFRGTLLGRFWTNPPALSIFHSFQADGSWPQV